jgi:hypothetical protein
MSDASTRRAKNTLYETDFYAWTQAQSAALRAKDFAALDLENLAEEIEGYLILPADVLEKLINRTMETSLATGTIHESKLFAAAFNDEEPSEGLEAFLERRKPSFAVSDSQG